MRTPIRNRAIHRKVDEGDIIRRYLAHEPADSLGVTRTRLYNILKRHNVTRRRCTRDWWQLAVGMRARGFSVAEIAVRAGKSDTAVRYALARMDEMARRALSPDQMRKAA